MSNRGGGWRIENRVYRGARVELWKLEARFHFKIQKQKVYDPRIM